MNLIETIEDKFNRLCPDVIADIRVVAKQGIVDDASVTIFDTRIAPRLKSPLGLNDMCIAHFRTMVLSDDNLATRTAEGYMDKYDTMPQQVDEVFGEPVTFQLNQYIAEV